MTSYSELYRQIIQVNIFCKSASVTYTQKMLHENIQTQYSYAVIDQSKPTLPQHIIEGEISKGTYQRPSAGSIFLLQRRTLLSCSTRQPTTYPNDIDYQWQEITTKTCYTSLSLLLLKQAMIPWSVNQSPNRNPGGRILN